MANKQNLKTAIDRRLNGVQVTEAQIHQVLAKAQPKPRRNRLRLLIPALALVAIMGTALALGWPATVSWIQGLWGDKKAADMMAGTLMPIHQTRVLGQVQYEWLETIHIGAPDSGSWQDGPNGLEWQEPEGGQEGQPMLTDGYVLYGSIRVTPVEGANIVLLPEDTEVTMFPGFNRGRGEIAPEGSLSYLDLAIQKDAKIIQATVHPKSIILNGRLQEGYEMSFDYLSNPDGSLMYHYEIPAVKTNEAYTILLRINNWEVTRTGEWLRGEPTDTWLKDDWEVTVYPGE